MNGSSAHAAPLRVVATGDSITCDYADPIYGGQLQKAFGAANVVATARRLV